jgi:aspartate/methionine/tyrosine aminotransferase
MGSPDSMAATRFDSDAIAAGGVITRRIDRMLRASAHPDPVRLGGTPAVDLPAHVLDAVRATPARSSYADSQGNESLRHAIVADVAADGIAMSAERVLVTNGAMHALDVCFHSLLAPGDGVLTHRPGYFIDGLVQRTGGVLQGFPSPQDDGFRPDWDAAERAVTPQTRVLFVNSPVNPTGYVFTDDDVQRAWQLAEEHDLWIVSDESYSHFLYGGRRHRSVVELDADGHRAILVRSFSKDHAMAGWRLGYAALPARAVDAAAATLEWSCLCVNQIAQDAGVAALTGPQDWIETFACASEQRGAATAAGVNAIPGLRCTPPQGGLNVLVGYDGDIGALVSTAVLRFGLGIQPGAAFGASGGFRFQFGGTAEAVESGLERLAAVVADAASDGNGGQR